MHKEKELLTRRQQDQMLRSIQRQFCYYSDLFTLNQTKLTQPNCQLSIHIYTLIAKGINQPLITNALQLSYHYHQEYIQSDHTTIIKPPTNHQSYSQPINPQTINPSSIPVFEIMTNYHPNCTLGSRTCVSGCCTSSGLCASTSPFCVYPYSDLSTNSSKYYYPGYAHSLCNATAKRCAAGCCTSTGSCATSDLNCVYYYSDFSSNSSKYYLPMYRTSYDFSPGVNVAALVGGIVGAVLGVLVLVGVVCWWVRRNRAGAMGLGVGGSGVGVGVNQTSGNEVTIIMGSNHNTHSIGTGQHLPTYGITQTTQINNQTYQYGMNQPNYQPYNQAAYHLAGQNPQGQQPYTQPSYQQQQDGEQQTIVVTSY